MEGAGICVKSRMEWTRRGTHAVIDGVGLLNCWFFRLFVRFSIFPETGDEGVGLEGVENG